MQQKEIKEKLRELSRRSATLEKEIQNRCKHSKYYITESGHWDTLGCYAGATWYKYCDGCGVKLDEKYVGGYNSKWNIKHRFGW